MNDHPNRVRVDFNHRLDQVRQEAEQLMRQAREIKEMMGGWREAGGRSAGIKPGREDRPGKAGKGLYRPAGVPYHLEALEKSIAELEAWNQRLSGREERLNNSLRDLEIRSGEIGGLTVALGESLAAQAAALPRLTVLAREIAAGRRILKRDQEELARVVNETIGSLEQKEQGRRLLLDLAKTTLLQGEKKRDHLQEILANQQALSEQVESCGQWLERTFDLFEEEQPDLNNFPGALQDGLQEFRDLAEELQDFHKGLQALEAINLEALLQGLTSRIQDEPFGLEKRPKRGFEEKRLADGSAGTSLLAPELAGFLETVHSLNEQMNLLSLNAFIASVQGGRKPEELAEVFGDIRVLSDRLKSEVSLFREKAQRLLEMVSETSGEEKEPPQEGPYGEERGILLRELAALLPAFERAERGLRELGRLADRLLDHLRWSSGQFQELSLQAREQTRFSGRLLEGLLPLRNSLQRLKRLQADQDFQVREMSHSLQKTLLQAAPIRKWFFDPGPGPGAPITRVETVREIVRALAGELFRQGQDEERLLQELERLGALPEAVEQFLNGQSQKQLEIQEAVEQVQGDYWKMNRDLATQRAALKTVIDQVRRLYENLEPFVQDSREQSAMNRELLEAFTEIRSRIQEQMTG